MELDKLKEFIQFMEDNNICELELEEEGKRIKLKKNTLNGQHAVMMPPINPAAAVQSNPEGEKNESNAGSIEVKSPMVGTFYRAPSPGAKPYTEIGDIVKPGDVLCIVEAMKLMNEIKAEIGGKIIKIPAENGEPVEFGQVMFLIEPA